MKKIIQIISISLFLSCNHGAAKIDIKDIKQHRAYQDSAIAKGKTPAEKLDVIRALISEYRNLGYREKDISSNYNYYLGRLYGKITGDVLPFNGFLYDTINKKLNQTTLYSNYIDSAIYYSEIALKLDSTNLFAFSNMVSTFFDDQMYKDDKVQEYPAMPYYPNRYNVEYQRNINYIFNNSIRFLDIDTSKDKIMSRFGVEFSYLVLSNSLNNQKLDFNESNILDQILKIDKFITAIDKFQDLIFLKKEYYRKDKNRWLPIIAQAKISYEKLHEWDNVTYVQYHNCEQMNLWIYSNGRYKQEIYEQDLSSLPYDERMNVNTYDLMCCTVPGLPKYITNKSEGTYRVVGAYYYFYPNKNSSYIIAGFDPDKNVKYMKLNGWGNLEYLRKEDFEKVVLTKRD